MRRPPANPPITGCPTSWWSADIEEEISAALMYILRHLWFMSPRNTDIFLQYLCLWSRIPVTLQTLGWLSGKKQHINIWCLDYNSHANLSKGTVRILTLQKCLKGNLSQGRSLEDTGSYNLTGIRCNKYIWRFLFQEWDSQQGGITGHVPGLHTACRYHISFIALPFWKIHI